MDISDTHHSHVSRCSVADAYEDAVEYYARLQRVGHQRSLHRTVLSMLRSLCSRVLACRQRLCAKPWHSLLCQCCAYGASGDSHADRGRKEEACTQSRLSCPHSWYFSASTCCQRLSSSCSAARTAASCPKSAGSQAPVQYCWMQGASRCAIESRRNRIRGTGRAQHLHAAVGLLLFIQNGLFGIRLVFMIQQVQPRLEQAGEEHLATQHYQNCKTWVSILLRCASLCIPH